MLKDFLIITICYFTLKLSLSNPVINYCKLPCSKQTQHTICELKHNCEVSSRCKNFTNLPLSNQEKQEIVDIHNKLRNRIAIGVGCRSVEGKLFPKAAAMRELVWDEELEFQAQCWANQCLVQHDRCRRKYDGQNAGQNLVWTEEESLTKSLHRFFDECVNTSASLIDENNKHTKKFKIGHFVQFIWWSTSQIGCARAHYVRPNRTYTRIFIGCNYAPKGNVIGSKIYPRGKPCSKCPIGTKCHKKYRGLCTTQPSTSKIPHICKFAADKRRCVPYLSINTNALFPNETYLEGERQLDILPVLTNSGNKFKNTWEKTTFLVWLACLTVFNIVVIFSVVKCN